MAQHTPGPWKVKHGDGYSGIYGTDGHGRIAKVTMRRSITANLTELAANTSLIAAAPDLLWLAERAHAIRTAKGWTNAERDLSWADWDRSYAETMIKVGA